LIDLRGIHEDPRVCDNEWFEPFPLLVRRARWPRGGKGKTALIRMGMGNRSNIESVGAGVYERKIDYGPGYRVYFGMDGDEPIILVGGGAKKRQAQDIETAKAHWIDYQARKKQR